MNIFIILPRTLANHNVLIHIDIVEILALHDAFLCYKRNYALSFVHVTTAPRLVSPSVIWRRGVAALV